jgi:hypothetical protein
VIGTGGIFGLVIAAGTDQATNLTLTTWWRISMGVATFMTVVALALFLAPPLRELSHQPWRLPSLRKPKNLRQEMFWLARDIRRTVRRYAKWTYNDATLQITKVYGEKLAPRFDLIHDRVDNLLGFKAAAELTKDFPIGGDILKTADALERVALRVDESVPASEPTGIKKWPGLNAR